MVRPAAVVLVFSSVLSALPLLWSLAELLNDDYIADRKLQVKTTTASGVTYTATGVQSAKNESIDGDLTIKAKVSGNSVTTKLFTSGKATAETTLDRLGVDGLALKLKAALAHDAVSGLATAEFINKNMSLTVQSSLTASPVVDASAVIAHAGWRLGATTSFATEAKGLTGANVTLAYADGGESEVTATLLNQATAAVVSYSHSVRPGFAVAAQFAYDQPSKECIVTAGTKTALPGGGWAKIKLDSLGSMSLAFIHEVRPGTTMVLSSRVGLKDGPKGPPKLGLSLVVE